jgi:hypothetical protein
MAMVSDAKENVTNVYSELMEWDSFKIFYIIFHVILTFVGPGN